MSKADFFNQLIKLDPKLAAKALKNDWLSAKLKTDALLKSLNLTVKPTLYLTGTQ
jgi:hypothetical protein